MQISIITTSYNYGEYIAETIESVLNQTYADFEYIIFDDGSTDNSREIIESYAKKDHRIKFYTHANNENKGLIATNIAAIQKCKENYDISAGGGYIVFVESDDTITPDYLELKVQAAKKFPQASIIFNDCKLIGDTECPRAFWIKNYLNRKKELFKKGEFSFKELLFENIIVSFSCVMVKKEVLFNIQLNYSISQCYDWYLWISILYDNNELVYINKPLTDFRIHNTSLSNKKAEKNYLYEVIKLDKKKFTSLKDKFYYKILLFIINQIRLEKLFRPQVRLIKEFLLSKLYKTKSRTIKITTI